ncbi:hypothetical protein Q9G87_49330 [Nonomuraea sp. G32]|nr:hypothetical protein [Nonomuraea sp. G32]MDP4510032.1 hypothetical protein [Nonomuraea sp. G32]
MAIGHVLAYIPAGSCGRRQRGDEEVAPCGDVLGGSAERRLDPRGHADDELLGFAQARLVEEDPGVGGMEGGPQHLVAAAAGGGDGTFGADGGKVVAAQVDHHAGCEVVGHRERIDGVGAGRGVCEPRLGDEAREPGDEAGELAGPVGGAGVVDGLPNVRQWSRFAVVAIVEVGEEGRRKEDVAEGKDAAPVAVGPELVTFPDEARQLDVEGVGDPHQRGEPGTLALALFELGDEVSREVGGLGEFLLGEPPGLASRLESRADRASVGHRP